MQFWTSNHLRVPLSLRLKRKVLVERKSKAARVLLDLSDATQPALKSLVAHGIPDHSAAVIARRSSTLRGRQ